MARKWNIWKNPQMALILEGAKEAKKVSNVPADFRAALDTCIRSYIVNGPESIFSKSAQDGVDSLIAGLTAYGKNPAFTKSRIVLYYPATEEEEAAPAGAENFTSPDFELTAKEAVQIADLIKSASPMLADQAIARESFMKNMPTLGKNNLPATPAKPGKAARVKSYELKFD